MIELPHRPADLSVADTALAGVRGLRAMNEALTPVRAARERQAEREAAARAILETRRSEHDAAERVHVIEATILEGVDEALTTRGVTARAEATRAARKAKRALAAARDTQAQRAYAARPAVEACRQALAESERVWQGERAALEHLARALDVGERSFKAEVQRLAEAGRERAPAEGAAA